MNQSLVCKSEDKVQIDALKVRKLFWENENLI